MAAPSPAPANHPRGIPDESTLDALLSEPRAATVAALARCPGDVIVLGAGGKMGPTLARMTLAAARQADGARVRRVIAVSRFTSADAERSLQEAGVHTVQCNLLDPARVAELPDAPNVIFMAGQKFGTHDTPDRTWMMNAVVPAICARRYAGSRVVVFSTGNVYPLTPADGDGSRETDAPAPVGEYAWSCLARERIFEHAAATGTRVAVMRLNYAVALRYGVLTDLALRVWHGEPISLAMARVNVIWQGDANRAALELLPHAGSPAFVLNVTGREALSVREVALALGRRLDREPRFAGTEATDALLSNSDRMARTLGAPEVPTDTMLDWVADWVRAGRPLLGKPTHFDVRDGAF
ncbi:MAG TPA: NAD(P)-dependent oxidoreductase [Gemmatimonadaceae bacterium]|nr:NAD(P)-dependent oxidoreductase [Gemmatimonadaceae bacterium]